MKSRGTIAAAIPAFQAGPSVGEIARRTLALLDEVLVIDDGSTDATAREAHAAGARVIRHERNRGKGRALLTGFTDLFQRGYQAVITLDADGQHLPEEIPRLLEAGRDGADLVVGGRDHLFSQMHAVRRMSNRWSSRAISFIAGGRLEDVQSGFRLYSRRLIEGTGFPESRFEAESAVVVRAARLGYRIFCVPIRLGYADGRVTSHYRPIVDSLRIARAVVLAWLETRAVARRPGEVTPSRCRHRD